MSAALEQEILEKFQQLDPAACARVREAILHTAPRPDASAASAEQADFDYEAWLADIKAIRQAIETENGGEFPKIDAVGILRDIRDGVDE